MTQDMVKMMSQDKMIGKREILSSSPSPWFSRFLRAMLLLLMMTLGVGEMLGQDTGYSGFYYIANYTTVSDKARGYDENKPAENYYLCPAAVYYNDNLEMPHLTTKRTNRGANSIWELRKVSGTNYYHIIHYEEGGNGKYLVHNKVPSSISGLGKDNRFRVHLEANPTLENNNDVLFIITQNSGTDKWFSITPKPDEKTSPKRSLNPASGNKDSYAPLGDEKNGNKTYSTGGIIGLWRYDRNSDDGGSRWYLEKAAPIIRYNSESTIKITYPDPAASIYYSFGEDSTPSPSTEGTLSYTGPFDLPSGTTTIKAIAVNGDKQSGIATYKLPFLLGSTHKYIIQSKNCQFYRLIPNVSVDVNTKYVSTLNVPSTTMAWHFEYAEDFYYYIVDENGWYMYYTANDDKYIYLKSSKDNDDDGFKFNIESHADGGYNIMPKGQGKSIYKINYGGSNDAGLKPVMYEGTITEDVARWDLIPYSTTNLPMWENSPFDVSTDNVTNYYNIVSVSQTTKPLILNNDGEIKSQTLPELNYDSRKSMWVIKKVEDENSELLDFYTLQNAYTGELLYYNGNGRDYVQTVLQLGQPTAEGADATWSHFVIVQTANGYNIIPRPIVDNTKAINRTSNDEGFNCINRRGGGDVLGTFFDDGDGSRWTFSQVDFCMPPVFEKTGTTITLSCATNGAEIHYTTNGTEPSAESALYENGWDSSTKNRIKAIAVVKSGETVTASSDVVTLLNKPDIILKKDGAVIDNNTYTYDGTAKEPGVTVSITSGENTVTAPTSPATYTVTYSNNTDANTETKIPTVTVTDASDTDNWYIWNTSETHFTINPKAVTITAEDASKTYNGSALTQGEFTATALETSDTHTFTVAMTAESTITNVGTQPNVIATVDEVAVTTGSETRVGNYLVTTVDGALTINPKAVTITANNASKTYNGSALTQGEFTATALEAGDTHTFTVVMTEGSTITNIGTQSNVIATVDGVSVTTGTETAVGNYLVTTANGTLEVTTKEVTITAKDGSKAYDGSPLTEGGFTTTVLEDGDTHTFTVAMTEGSTITNVGTQSNVIATVDGVVVTTGTATEVGNYLVTTANGTLTVTAKAVTITAKDASKTYDGTALTEGGFTASDLEAGDTHEFTVAMTEGSTITNVGTQSNVIATVDGVAVTTGTATEVGNYLVTTADGTLTITGKEITISGITAENKVYNGTTDAVLVYTGVTFTGKLDGDDLTVTATGTFEDKNVGTGKTVTITGFTFGGNDAANYTYNGGDLTATADITPASVTVTAEDKTKGYGDADPELTWTVEGLQGTDTKDVLTVSISRIGGEDVNEDGYIITPSGDNDQGNYSVTSYTTGKLTITAKAIGDGTTPAEGIDIDITYDGTDYTVTVKQGENILLKDQAYTWTGADGDTDTYVVTITGQGNYNNSAKATYIKQTFYDITPDQVLTTETTAAVYCATQNLKVNDTFEAYYVTKLENNSLTITKVEAGEGENKKNYIPEGQPVLLISETNPAPKGFTLKPYTGTDLVTIPTTGEGANLLKVVPDEGGRAVNLEEVYIFSMGEFVLNKAGTMSKGKFYLENPDYNTSAHSRSILSITSGDVTGIHTSQLSDTDSQIPDIWYTIGGQKLHKKPTRKGLYLHNGKKVVIK